MTQAELAREISRATGDSIATINRLGFSLMEPETDYEPRMVDWEAVDARRVGLFASRRPGGHHRAA